MPCAIVFDLHKRVVWRISIPSKPVIVGSASNATIRIADPDLAAEEVAVEAMGNGYRVRDVSQRGRLYVNGRSVTEASITAGEPIRIGRHAIVLTAERDPDSDELERLEHKLVSRSQAAAWIGIGEEADRGNETHWSVVLAIGLAGAALGVVAAILFRRLVE